MAKEHKYHHARIEIDTGLSVDEALNLARQVVATNKSLRHSDEYENAFSVLVKNWVGLTLIHFTVSAWAESGRTLMRTELLEYNTSQSMILYLIPAGPKTIEGFGIYRQFMSALGQVMQTSDPSALFGITEVGQGGGLFDSSPQVSTSIDTPLVTDNVAAPPANTAATDLAHAPQQSFEPQPIDPQPVDPQPIIPQPIDPQRASQLVVDPAATAYELAEIAATYPTLRDYVRAHPACYPDLAQWIDQVRSYAGS